MTSLQTLLDKGAELEAKDEYGRTALAIAANNNHVEAMKLLLNKGAELEAKDKDGRTALVVAARNGHFKAMELLLDKGAELEAKDEVGRTALVIAASYKHVTAMHVLLDRGANTEAKDKVGNTAAALIVAEKYSVSTIKLLLKAMHANVTAALDAELMSWGAIPSSASPFQRPSAWSVATILVELLKTRLTEVWAEALPVARQIFAKAVPLIAASDEAQRGLLAIFEERKRGSLTQYRATLTRTRRDGNYPEFTSVSRRLQQKLASRRGECVQQRPTGGGALDFVKLRAQADKVKPRFDAFIEALATKCGAEKTAAPLKGAWRAIEKMALRVESAGEKCGALKDGPLDAAPLCDVLRGSLKCKDFTMLLAAFELLEALDAEFGDLSQARGLTQRIRLLRIKDRFSTPTSGGWADVLVNFVFEDDATKHVAELQLQHESMLLVRKEGGGHQDYNEFRSAFELLEAVGKEPHDNFEDTEHDAEYEHEHDAGTEAAQAHSGEVAALQKKVNSLEDRLAAQEKLIEAQAGRIEAQAKQLAEMQAVLTRLVHTDATANRPETLGEPGKVRGGVGGGKTSRPSSGSAVARPSSGGAAPRPGSGSMTKPKKK